MSRHTKAAQRTPLRGNPD